jgi:sarcosine oxidase
MCVCAAGEAVQGWTVLPDGLVEVATDRGTYRAERLVLAAGAWMDQLVPELQVRWCDKGVR